jgi:hypothetical protein
MGGATMISSLGESWVNFFMTAAGASAALVGLVIVAISVNVQPIIRNQHLPSRAGATVGALVLILVSSMAALIPQSLAALGIEILAFGLLTWLLQIWSASQVIAAQSKLPRPMREWAVGVTIGQMQVIPFLLGAILLMMGKGTGIYWIAWGVVAVFVFSVINAWIFLVEILR